MIKELIFYRHLHLSRTRLMRHDTATVLGLRDLVGFYTLQRCNNFLKRSSKVLAKYRYLIFWLTKPPVTGYNQ